MLYLIVYVRASMASKSMAAGSVDPMRWIASVGGGTRCSSSLEWEVTVVGGVES